MRRARHFICTSLSGQKKLTVMWSQSWLLSGVFWGPSTCTCSSQSERSLTLSDWFSGVG